MTRRIPLPQGTVLVHKTDRYKIIGTSVEFTRQGLLYRAINEKNQTELIIKEILPDGCGFERDSVSLLVKSTSDNSSEKFENNIYMSGIKQTVKQFSKYPDCVFQSGMCFRAVPQKVLSETEIHRNNCITGTAYDSFCTMESGNPSKSKDSRISFLSDIWKEFQKKPEKEFPFRYGGHIPVLIIIDIIEQILLALAEIHRAGYVYGKLEWGNIAFNISSDNQIKSGMLLDFNTCFQLYKNNCTDRILSNINFPAKEFCPLEMLNFKKGYTRLSTSTDTYAVTYLLFLMCGGRLFISNCKQEPALQLYENPDLYYISHLKTGLSEKNSDFLNKILSRGLSSRMEDRYPNAAEMLNDILYMKELVKSETVRNTKEM